MNKIDFNKENPTFDTGDFKWYLDSHFQNYLKYQQADNLPSLNGLGCFIVKGKDVEDYVLIDDKQNVIAGYPYNFSGHEQMMEKIKIIKISKHYDEYEKANV